MKRILVLALAALTIMALVVPAASAEEDPLAALTQTRDDAQKEVDRLTLVVSDLEGDFAEAEQAVRDADADLAAARHGPNHQMLTEHGLHELAAHLTRARHHQLHALLALRRLTDRSRRGLLDTPSLAAVLELTDTDLTTAGRAIVDSDHALLGALHTLPSQGGDRYSQ
jgi:hypothetical protein